MFSCPQRTHIRLSGRSVWLKLLVAVLTLLLVLQFILFKLWERHLHDADGDDDDVGKKEDQDKADAPENLENVVKDEDDGGNLRGIVVDADDDSSIEKISSMDLKAELKRYGRNDASDDYVIVDDVCQRWETFCRWRRDENGVASSSSSSSSSSTTTSSTTDVLSLVTQSSVSNLYHLVSLSRRWNGVVSVAIFAPRLPLVRAVGAVIRALGRCGVVDGVRFQFHLVTLKRLAHGRKRPMEMGESRDGEDEDAVDDGEDKKKRRDFLDFRSEACEELESLLESRFSHARNYDDVAPATSSAIPYPVNLLRNVAITNAASTFVLVIDVDMMPSMNLERQFIDYIDAERKERKVVFEAKGRIAAVLQSHTSTPPGRIAYVVPAYELDPQRLLQQQLRREPRSTTLNIPESKTQLLNAEMTSFVRPFYSDVCWKCQKYTDYARWEMTMESELLKVVFVQQWADPWEPFYIIDKSQMPLYDERFKQYGFNRIQQVCELHIAGFQFHILNNPFLLHIGFKDKNTFHLQKQRENDENRILFRKFKQEMKTKYPNTHRRCY